jgi:hypothetical protein
MAAPRKHEFSPTPSEVLRYIRVYLRRSSEQEREKSKAADWVTAVSTALGLIFAGVSAVVVFLQLRDAHHNFIVDERAWIEIDVKPVPHLPILGTNQTVTKYNFVPKNIGKTVARDVSVTIDNPAPQADEKQMVSDYDKALSRGSLGKKLEVTQVILPNATATVPYSFSFLEEGDAWHYIVGLLDYKDAFGFQHHKWFCFRVSGKNFIPCSWGNVEDDIQE